MSKLPMWLKFVLAVLFLPFAILYGIYVMWRDEKFDPLVRLVLTAVGGVLALGLVSSSVSMGEPTTTQTGPGSPPIPAATQPAEQTAAPATPATALPMQEATAPAVAAPVVVPAPQPSPSPPQVQPSAPKPSPQVEVTVFKTRTGSKYHLGGCRYVSKSKIALSLSDAKAEGLGP